MYTTKKMGTEILVVRGGEVVCHLIIDEYASEEAAQIMADRIVSLLNEATSGWQVSSSKVLTDAEKNEPENVKHSYETTHTDDDAIQKAVDDAFELAKQGKSVKIKRI